MGVFSEYVKVRYARQLLADNPSGVGYLLKDRVADVAEFVDALTRVATGGTALDPTSSDTCCAPAITATAWTPSRHANVMSSP
jgi:hypothetical protein